MKRFFIIILAIVLFASLCTDIFSSYYSYAEGEQENPDSIQFRGLTWYDSLSNVSLSLDFILQEGSYSVKRVQENCNIIDWDKSPIGLTRDEIYIEDGGAFLTYHDVSVAGYKAKLLNLEFAYAIEGEKVIRNSDSAVLFTVHYYIEELEDTEAAYKDIVEKMTHLYGQSKDKSHFNVISEVFTTKGSLWEAKDGSKVWVSMKWNYDRYDELIISYAAPDTEKYLSRLAALIEKEIVEAEASNREENSNNYDGL